MKQHLPSYPLFIKDPYFSIYSNGDILNDSDVTFWTGISKKLYGFIKIDGKLYSFLGKSNIEKLPQLSINISTFKTTYIFKKDDFEFILNFTSPLTLDDLNLLSMPICYLSYEFKSETKHEIEVSLALNEGWLYNEANEALLNGIHGETFSFPSFKLSSFRGKRQLYIAASNDEYLADQGTFYLSGEESYFLDGTSLQTYLNNNFQLTSDGEDKYLFAINRKQKGIIAIGREDYFSFQYFDEMLTPYYFKDGKNIFDGFKKLYKNFEKIENKLNKFDEKLKQDSLLVNENYYQILVASYRQAIAAHKLGITKNNELVFISKECGSNGCAATVDITYPTSPILFLYNPNLLKASLKPIFDFAKKPIWKFDFAPHDAGKYPTIIGQVYAYKFKQDSPYENYDNIFNFPKNKDIYDFKYQMPVEESANMIILSYGLYYYSKDLKFLKQNYKTLHKWANYLLKHGLIPENQLCTDDFSGHLDKNTNLSIKSVVALRCFYEIAKKIKDKKTMNVFKKGYKNCVNFIENVSNEKEFLPLTYEKDDNRYSLKYNLAFDKVFKFNLFSESLYNKEINEYKKHGDKFGLPLDPRDNFVKVDWSMWVASFSDDILKKELINQTIYFLENTKTRKPFPDWYRSSNGDCFSFKNRTVVGGNFLPLLIKLK